MARLTAHSHCPDGYGPPLRQRGVALIASLAVLAIAVTTATGIAYQVHLNMRRAQNVVGSERAWQYAFSAEKAAMAILARDSENSDIDYREAGIETEPWFTKQPVVRQLPGNTELMFAVTDLQARFNLNIVDGSGPSDSAQGEGGEEESGSLGPALDQFERLMSRASVPTDGESVATALADWIDSDRKVRFPGGAEDDHYSRLDVPHRAANTAMVSPTEIKRIKGLEGDSLRPFWNALCPHVTALPDDAAAVNVNTASAEVLASLAASVQMDDAEQAVAQREDNAYSSVDDFLERNRAFNVPELANNRLAVASEYFLLHARISRPRSQFHLYSVIHRPAGSNADGGPRVIRRSRVPPHLMGGRDDASDGEQAQPCIGARLNF